MSECPNPGCVVKVGAGRGFIVEHRVKIHRVAPLPAGMLLPSFRKLRLVVTAAHCLPHLPPPHAGSFTEERTYQGLLGILKGSRSGIWAECLFVDPVADVAVLGSPDYQDFSDEADAYDDLTKEPPALRVGDTRSGPGWVLSLDGRWVPTVLKIVSTTLDVGATQAGMSHVPTGWRARGYWRPTARVPRQSIDARGRRDRALGVANECAGRTLHAAVHSRCSRRSRPRDYAS